MEAFRHLDLHIPEQVIEVPKISSSRRRCRRRRVPVVQQTAEQLVEVPEFVSFAFLFQQQIVDAPGRPQGLLPGQDYSLVWEQIEDTPVPHGRGRAHRGGLQGARPGQNSAAFMEHSTFKFQSLKVVVAGEVFSVCAQTRIQLLHPFTLELRMRFFQWVFALFPEGKSATLGPHSGSELSADFNQWTPAACGVPMVPEPVLEVESEEYFVTRMDEFGRRCFGSDVYPGRWFLHDTSDGVVWWDEPG